MKFGPLAISKAKGAILAHSIRLPNGRLRKGLVLGAEEIAALNDAGLKEVTVAQLEAGDLHENEAASRLAEALCDGTEGISLSTAFTGRVNLLAKGPGVVLIDANQINSANAVEPMITVATVPPHHQIHAGGMIATAKIISYAVSEEAVERAVRALRGAVKLARPVYSSASLILTQITGMEDIKGEEAISARLKGLNMSLCETLKVAHEEANLSKAIKQAKGEIVLILTSSATSDISDTAPSALFQAGGHVERFGMPVDPGNLMFLGNLGGRPVIGLPGSARSPVLHGADWVLSRIACGVPTGSEDISAMGVGGLLKEIPTRPQPRQRKLRD